MTDDVINYVIGQLRGACWEEEAVAIETLVKQRDDLQRDQTYSYIGKDMKRWLARDLEDAKDEALAKLEKVVDDLRNMVAVAEQDEWHKATTGRQIILKSARITLAEQGELI